MSVSFFTIFVFFFNLRMMKGKNSCCSEAQKEDTRQQVVEKKKEEYKIVKRAYEREQNSCFLKGKEPQLVEL